MIPTAVSPIAMPPRICRDERVGYGLVNRRSGMLLAEHRRTHAETMNMPSAAASIRYSGQCVRRAGEFCRPTALRNCDRCCLHAVEGQMACEIFRGIKCGVSDGFLGRMQATDD